MAGEKVVEIVQEEPAESVNPQLLVSPKFAAFVPPSVMVEMVSVAEPELVKVTVRGELVLPWSVAGKVTEVADSVASGTAPAPVSATVCGEPAALSATLSVPVTVPAATGVKFTGMVQFEPAASVVPQVVPDSENVALPVSVMAIPASEAAPVFESVTVLAPADVPNADEKLSEVGESDATGTGTGAAPAPLSVTVWVDPPAPPVLSVRIRFAL